MVYLVLNLYLFTCLLFTCVECCVRLFLVYLWAYCLLVWVSCLALLGLRLV